MSKIFLNYRFWNTFNEVNNRAEFYKFVRIFVASEFSMIAPPLQGASSLCECPYRVLIYPNVYINGLNKSLFIA